MRIPGQNVNALNGIRGRGSTFSAPARARGRPHGIFAGNMSESGGNGGRFGCAGIAGAAPGVNNKRDSF